MTQIASTKLGQVRDLLGTPWRLKQIDFAHKINVVCVKEFGYLYKGVPVMIKYLSSIHIFSRASIEEGLYKHWQAYLKIDDRRCVELGISRREAEISTQLN